MEKWRVYTTVHGSEVILLSYWSVSETNWLPCVTNKFDVGEEKRVWLVVCRLVIFAAINSYPNILNYIKDWVHVQTWNLHRFAYNRDLRVTVGVD